MTDDERLAIEQEIKSLEDEEKRLEVPCLFLLKRTNLQNKLDWDNYLKNGCSEEDVKLFREITDATTRLN
jgi:hypothetical protein